MESAIYTGTLRHRRFEPSRHAFTYPLFMAFLDIDRIPELMAVSPFASYNRFNWAGFHERDHFGDPALPLRERLKADAAQHDLGLPDGPIFLLTHLRYLGYNFNPISLFYCYDAGGKLETILAEVNNTFGESRNYWLSAGSLEHPSRQHVHRCRKSMHVSPFLPMELDYRFVLPPPGDQLVAHMSTLDGGHANFDATLTLHREPWSAPALHRALRRFPWMTAKVIAAIHWEAWKLYLKKVPVYTHPARRKENHHEAISHIPR
ncbi:MAG: DUF1365 domain-containing protein [Acidobacteriota bacterium]|nr:DUF1365 domain-containing protein [Acidobacteriota bacterium]